MKDIFQKLSCVKGKQWLMLVLAVSLLLWTLLPADNKNPVHSKEDEIASVLSRIEGVGKVSVLIYYDDAVQTFSSSAPSVPRGAVAVAQGAKDISVQIRLRSALEALLSLSPDRVEVFPMEEQHHEIF